MRRVLRAEKRSRGAARLITESQGSRSAETHERRDNGCGTVDRWPETGYVKKLQRKDNTFYYYNKQRECEDKESGVAWCCNVRLCVESSEAIGLKLHSAAISKLLCRSVSDPVNLLKRGSVVLKCKALHHLEWSPITGLLATATVARANANDFAKKCPGGTSTDRDPLKPEYFWGPEIKKEREDTERIVVEQREDVKHNKDKEAGEEVEREEEEEDMVKSDDGEKQREQTQHRRQRRAGNHTKRSPLREDQAMFLAERGSTRLPRSLLDMTAEEWEEEEDEGRDLLEYAQSLKDTLHSL
ncbi:hypothetical protein NDU88_004851 [Pleurodeles waltl]|uniref:Uncharacterized protein n=1 Tax=Pleurodeles waltl TaxID=8319 RepID=A0AAV7SJZ2_PLEWA|nr:hypothetical protein NDU88_004851 [Pleurodeles waltl]